MIKVPRAGWTLGRLAAIVALGGCGSSDSSGLFDAKPPTGSSDAGASTGSAPSGPGNLTPNQSASNPSAPNPSTGSAAPSGAGSEATSPAVAGGVILPAGMMGTGPGAPASDAGGVVPAPEAPDAQAPDAGAVAPAEPPPACAGTPLDGACWYVGDPAQTCSDVCTPHGGVSVAAVSVIGSLTQGGSIEGCARVLSALGVAGEVASGFREDGLGFGCHLFIDVQGVESPWWLSAPDLSPAASAPEVRRVCGCTS